MEIKKYIAIIATCLMTLGCRTAPTPSHSSLWSMGPSSQSKLSEQSKLGSKQAVPTASDAHTASSQNGTPAGTPAKHVLDSTAQYASGISGGPTESREVVVSDAAFSALIAQPKVATHHPTNRYVQLKVKPTANKESTAVVPTVAADIDLGDVTTSEFNSDLRFGPTTPPKVIPRTPLKSAATTKLAKTPESVLTVMPFATQEEPSSPSDSPTVSSAPIPLEQADDTPSDPPAATSSSTPSSSTEPLTSEQPVVTKPTCQHCQKHAHGKSTSCDEYVPY